MVMVDTQEWKINGVQNTCISSLKSKLSSALGGYLTVKGNPKQLSNPEFFQYFVNGLGTEKPPRRSALINRGYSIRQLAIDWVMNHLCETYPIQVVNLGCGLDPLYFRFKPLMNSSYFLDVDLPDIARRKISTILSTVLCNSFESVLDKRETRLVTKNYACIGADLTLADELIDIIENSIPNFHMNKPTLFISECVLSYLSADKADNLISTIIRHFPLAYFLLYEQIVPTMDSFSVKMLGHFQIIQSPLNSIEHGYKNLSNHFERFLRLGCKKVEGTSMDYFFYKYLEKEFDISSYWSTLEPFDEMEEWDIKMQHYMLLMASNHEFGHQGLRTSMEKLQNFRKLELGNRVRIFTSPISDTCDDISRIECQYKRWGYSSVMINNLLVIFGGNGLAFHTNDSQQNHSIKRQNDILLLDLDTRKSLSYNSSEAAPSPRIHHQAVPYSMDMQSRIEFFLFGGRHSPDNPLDDAWIGKVVLQRGNEADLRAEISFTELFRESPWPSARYRHAMTTLKDNGKDVVILSGGVDSYGNTLNDIWIFYESRWYLIDIVIDQKCESFSSNQSNILCKRHSHTINSHNGMLLLVGGRCKDQIMELPFIVIIALSSSLKDQPWRIVKCIVSNPYGAFIYGHKSHLMSNGKNLIILGGCKQPSNDQLNHQILMISFGEDRSVEYISDVSALVPEHVTISMINGGSIYNEFKDELWIFGGGFTCFSMGSHFDSTILCIPKIQHKLFMVNISDLIMNIEQLSMRHVPIIPYGNSYNNYLFREPFVIRRVPLGPISTEWTWKNLEDSCPSDMKVSIHVSSVPHLAFHQRNFEYKVTKWSDFITSLFDTKDDTLYYYMRAVDGRHNVADLERNFPNIAKAFNFPSNLIPNIKEKIFSSVLRLSSPKVQLWTHYDVMDNVLCQIWGTKRVIIWPPEDLSGLSIKGSSTTLTSHSVLNRDQSNAINLHPVFCNMYPGDILYIPPCWFHQVTAGDKEPSLAINMFWKQEEEHLYDSKDLFGNRDLVPFTRATEKLASIIKEMKKELPERYKEFYLEKLQLFIEEFRNKH